MKERWYKRMSSNKFNQSEEVTSFHTLYDFIIIAEAVIPLCHQQFKNRGVKKHELKLDCIVCWQAFNGIMEKI